MAITEWYVNGSTGTDDLAAGRGESSGDPWATIVYALDTGIPNTGQGANGDRLNIAAGTYTITKALSSTTYGTTYTPSSSRPLYFVGASSSNTTIDGDGTYSIWNNSTKDYIGFRDLELTNTGSNYILRVDGYCHIVRCSLHNTSSHWVLCGSYNRIFDCLFYNNSGTTGIACGFGSKVEGCYFSGTTATPSTVVIDFSSLVGCACKNMIRMLAGQNGIAIRLSGIACEVINNSIYAAATTGTGIQAVAVNPTVIGNIIDGFSGTGGNGIDLNTGGAARGVLANNAVYNCTTAYTGDTTESNGWLYVNDNETLSSSPFTDAANGDFTPVDTGNVKEGGWPDFTVPFGTQQSYPWKGAIQPQAAGGGGTSVYLPTMQGRFGVMES